MGRLRGCLWLVAGLVLAGIAAVVAYITLSTAELRLAGVQEGAPPVEVVVAVTASRTGEQLTAEDVELRKFPREVVPAGALSAVEQAIGRLTRVDLNPGEIILQQRLEDPNIVSGDARRALLVEEDRVLMAYPADDLLTTMDILRPMDHVDIHITYDFPANRGLATAGAYTGTTGGTGGAEEEKSEKVTFVVLQNVVIAGLVGRVAPSTEEQSATEAVQSGRGEQSSAPPKAILLALLPQDALVLKFLKDAGGIQDIVLRPPGAEQPFDVKPVDIDYVIRRYEVPIEVGR